MNSHDILKQELATMIERLGFLESEVRGRQQELSDRFLSSIDLPSSAKPTREV
ncbi:MAG: hypothetical protein N2170_01795 [Bacteroidia bacterium]|nr:hypothetical protein [Bacteroidia bacterium]